MRAKSRSIFDLDEASQDSALPRAIQFDFEFELHGDAAARIMIDQEDINELMTFDE